jgi:hypothetical protein
MKTNHLQPLDSDVLWIDLVAKKETDLETECTLAQEDKMPERTNYLI